MITSRGLNVPLFLLFSSRLLVCRLYFCHVSKRLPRVLSGCVFLLTVTAMVVAWITVMEGNVC